MRNLRAIVVSGFLLLFGAIAQAIVDRIFDWTMINLPPISLSDMILIVGIVVGVALIILGKWGLRNRETKLDERFTRLEVHYSQKSDNPDSSNPARPYYILNKDTNQAYWVSNLIIPYIKMNKIQYNTHDGEKALNKYFKKREITINETNPMPEQLGLIFKRGSLIRQIAEPQIVTKLKGFTLSDLEIMRIYPFRYRCPLLSHVGKHTAARLLIKHSTKETYKVPLHDLDLVDYSIIALDSSIYRLFFDNYEKWSRRKKYTYVDQRFSEEQLLEEKRGSHDK